MDSFNTNAPRAGTPTSVLSRRLFLLSTAISAMANVAFATPLETGFSGAGIPVEIGKGYRITSHILGDTRRINISLPTEYTDPATAHKRYPVLYLLDGGDGWQDFAHIAGMVQQGGTWGANAPVIVVGIESKDRKAELTPPSTDPEERKTLPTSGKATLFRRFMVEELRPLVDAAYRTDGVNAIMGESLAGLFVVDTFLRFGGQFQKYIAVSPSLWWDYGNLSKMSDSLLRTRATTPRALWLSIGNEGGSMQAGVDRLVAALKDNPADKLVWAYRPLNEESHATIYHPAATQGVRFLFPGGAK
jgi:hypothetical protein